MVSKILAIYIIIAAITFSGSVLFFQQQNESENGFQVYKEKFNDVEWNTEVTKILPREGELGNEWMYLWSESSEKFVAGELPIMIKKTIRGNEILSTSYSYSHEKYGTYQVLIWKGELVSDWNPKESIENIFSQTDAKTEKVLEGLDLIPNCVVAYYDYYGDEKEVKNDLLFSECAKKDFRIRINLVEGEYTKESIEELVFLSNLVIGKI